MQTVPRDLTTPRERPSYKIDGGRVMEMRSPYDLTLEEFNRVEGLIFRLGSLLVTLDPAETNLKLTKKDAQQIREQRAIVMAELCAIALGRPDALKVIGELRAMVVCTDFMLLCAPAIESLNAGRANLQETPSPSPSSFPRSAGSTPARRPATGRAKRR
jgi:hypothetical protein